MKRRIYYIHGFDFRGVAWYHKFFKKSAPSCFKIADLEDNKFKINNDIEFVILSWQEIVLKNWFGKFKIFLIFLAHFFQFFFTSKYKSLQKMDTKLAVIIKAGTIALFCSLLILILSLILFGKYAALLSFIVMSAIFVFLFKKLNLFWLFLTTYFVDKKISVDLINVVTGIFLDAFNAIEKSNPAEEIIFLAHSVGTVYIPQLINMISGQEDGNKKISTAITFGSILPFLYLTNKKWLFDELTDLSNKNIPWHDFSAKSDALCFFCTDLYKLCGISGASVYLHNLRFASYFKPFRWKRLRSNKLLVHFLYFKKYDQGAKYNFFEMLCSDNIQNYLEGLLRA